MDKIIKRIVELSKTVADKIAAGEVVDRPLSIVKELVENAIDAGSTSIVVEIKNGGKAYIRVTDNGCGIAKEDVELAFKRHATSKIREASDLDHISSLGFRGEALASIAAVSKTELITKTADEKSGISVKIEGGEIAEKVDMGCPDGTTVIICDLFYNTPARLKFMKPDATESTLIIDFISKLALAYPAIKIRLINNGNILFSTPGKNDIYTNIMTIYSKEIGNQLIHFTETSETMSLEGFVSSPNYSKTNRKSQIFFVNGRYISSKLLENAVMEGYAEKLFDKRYPIVFLFFKIAPEKLDVNIHPNKKEVRFDDDKAVKDFISAAIRKNLNTKEAIPTAKPENIFKFKTVKETVNESNLNKKSNNIDGMVLDQVALPNQQKVSQIKLAEYQEETKSNSIKLAEYQKETNSNSIKLEDSQEKLKLTQRELEYDQNELDTTQKNATNDHQKHDMDQKQPKDHKSEELQSKKEEVDIRKLLSTRREAQQKNAEFQYETPHQVISPAENIVRETDLSPILTLPNAPVKKPFDVEISQIKTKGSLFGTYIIGVDEDHFYLIDQHAAHERIFYEQLLMQYHNEDKLQQLILVPFVVNVTYAIKNDAYSFLDFLCGFGYDIEEFGPKAYLVKGIPIFMELEEAKSFLDDFLDNIDQGIDFKDQRKIDKIISNSCKKAVKAHDLLDEKEIERLMEDLAKCQNPYSCPHGRPTFIKMSKYEIEKMFKRV